MIGSNPIGQGSNPCGHAFKISLVQIGGKLSFPLFNENFQVFKNHGKYQILQRLGSLDLNSLDGDLLESRDTYVNECNRHIYRLNTESEVNGDHFIPEFVNQTITVFFEQLCMQFDRDENDKFKGFGIWGVRKPTNQELTWLRQQNS